MSYNWLVIRYPTPAVRERINALFELRDDQLNQDWPLEVSDGGRVEEFLDAYEWEPLNDDERYALMELILYSLDERLMEVEEEAALEDRVRATLMRDFHLHRPTVEYWCLFEKEKETPSEEWLAHRKDYQFKLTPVAREIWIKAVGRSL